MSDDRARQLLQEATSLRLSRRGVLKRATALGVSGAALGGVLSATGHAAAAPARRAPAFHQARSLNVLAGSYFVPTAEPFFQSQVEEWGGQNNVELNVDFINWPDIQPQIAAAVEGGAGPDIVELRPPWPFLYYENLVPMDDVVEAQSDALGGFYPWATDTTAVDGKWFSIPVGTSSAAFAYRISYLEQAGVTDPKNNFPGTWEELFALGKTLKEQGKPIGQAFGRSPGDPPGFAYSYMWAHGAMEVEEDGVTVAFNTPEFVAGMEQFLQAWTDAFDETGLSWEDSTNNQAFLSDQLSITLNGSSIYLTAKNAEAGTAETDYEVVVPSADIWHAQHPEGPAGRFMSLGSWSYGVLSSSENQEAAKEFLTWWTSRDHLVPWLEAQEGYIIPATAAYAELPVYTTDPSLAPFIRVADFARNAGYAGPTNQQAAQVTAQYVISDTFAQAIQSGDAAGAIERGAQQLQRIYGG